MATTDNEELFSSDDMRIRWEATYEFLADDGVACGLNKDYLIEALGYLGGALRVHGSCEGLWKAYVMLDVLIDRWGECFSILKDEEAAHGRDR